MRLNLTRLRFLLIVLVATVSNYLLVQVVGIRDISAQPADTGMGQTTALRPAIHAIPSADGTAIFIAAERLEGLSTPIYANLGPTSHGRGHTGEMQFDSPQSLYTYNFEGLDLSDTSSLTVSITTTVGTSGTTQLGLSTLALGYVPGDRFTELVSPDKKLVLSVPTGVLADTRLIIMDTVAPPGDPAVGYRLLTQSYSIRPSGAITQSLAPMLLRLYYSPALLGERDPHTVSMFRWDATTRQWQDIESEPFFNPADPGGNQPAHVKDIQYFGAYALMTGPTWRDSFPNTSGLVERQNIRLAFGGRLGLPSTATQGYALSGPITATQPFSAWGQLRYSAEITTGTSLRVDVLASDGQTVLLENLRDGASLASIDTTQHTSLRLRVVMNAQQAGITPYLDDWAVNWAPTYPLFLPWIEHSTISTSDSTLLRKEQMSSHSFMETLQTRQSADGESLGCDPPDAPPILWQAIQTISNQGLFAIAPDVAMDSEDRLHAVWFGGEGHLEDANLFYATKEPGSTTWSMPVILLPPGSQAWYPAIAIDQEDTVHVIWAQLKPLTFVSDIEYMFRPRGGVWSSPIKLSNTGKVRNGPNLDIFADADGAIHVVWSDKSPGNDEIFYTVKQSGQATWQAPEQVSHTSDNSAAATIVVDNQGTVHIAWNDVASNGDIYYASRSSITNAWNEPVNVSQSSATSLWPAMVVDPNDNLHLVWQENTRSETYDQIITLHYNVKLANTVWQTTTAQTLAQSVIPFLRTENVQAPALAIDASSGLHVAWTNMSDHKVYYMTRPDPDAGWSAPQIVTSVIPPNDPTDNYLTAITIDRQGSIHLLWGDMQSIEHFSDALKYATAQPTPIAENHVLVLDESHRAVSGACIYQNGRWVGTTDVFGVFALKNLSAGDHLVALKPIDQQLSPHTREWTYRTALTNLNIDETGQVTGDIASSGGRQTLKLQKRPLIYFNLLISLQWNATDDYIRQLAEGVGQASNYLFDASDGQMAFGQVTIDDDGVNWEKADIQILARNDVRPYAYIGGIHDIDPSKKLIVGRHWDGSSGASGTWNEHNGFRTLVHEFGHYALHLYDSYFGYTFNDRNQVSGYNLHTGCTDPVEWKKEDNGQYVLITPAPATDATNATIMNFQYASSELSARDVPGLWEDFCTGTAQWQLNNGESDWETLIRFYKDQQQPERWQFNSPLDSRKVMTGPVILPADWLDFPQITTHPIVIPAPVLTITVLGPDGAPYSQGALAALETQRAVSGTQVILDQGQTNKDGRIIIYGAAIHDMVRVVSLGGDLSAALRVEPASQYTLSLESHSIGKIQAAAQPMNPYVSLAPGSDGDNITVAVHGVDVGATLAVLVIPPGVHTAQAIKLGYSPAEQAYTGTADFKTNIVGLGSTHVRGIDTLTRPVFVNSDFSLLRVEKPLKEDLFTPDGHAWLHLESDSFPTADTYLALMPTGAVPQPLPTAMVVVGNAYSLRASGSIINLQRPALLQLSYDSVQLESCSEPGSLQIGYWNGSQWSLQPGQVDGDHQAISMPITQLGIYALIAPECPLDLPLLYLPLIAKP